MTAHYLLPAGTVNNRTAYFYADSTEQFGPIIKKISDQILVILDYTTVLSGQVINGYKFTADTESNPPLYVTDPLINSTGTGLSFLVSGGIDGQQYNITVGLNPNIVTGVVLRDDVLTINMPSKSACDALIPPMVTLLGANSYVSTAIHFYWGPNPPTGQFVLDQWFNTTTNILYEWITNGTSFFWEEIGVGGPTSGGGGGSLIDAPSDSILYSRRNANWIPDPIQVDATSDGKIYVRNNGDWIPDPLQVDAPADGQVWGRKNDQWAVMISSAAGISDAPVDSYLYGRSNSAWDSFGTFSGAINVNGQFGLIGSQFTPVNVTANGPTTITRSQGEIQHITVNANSSLTIVSWPTAGKFAKIVLDVTNGGSYTLSFPSGTVWAYGAVPVLTPTGRDIYILVSYDGGATFLGTIIGQNYH